MYEEVIIEKGFWERNWQNQSKALQVSSSNTLIWVQVVLLSFRPSFFNQVCSCVLGSQSLVFVIPADDLRLLGSSGGFGRKFPEGGLNFLEVALVRKFPYGNLPKQSSKKFASEPPKLLRSPSRSGSMRKLVAELSHNLRLNPLSRDGCSNAPARTALFELFRVPHTIAAMHLSCPPKWAYCSKGALQGRGYPILLGRLRGIAI